MENRIPVNIDGGVPSILDGAGAIKDVVGAETIKNIEEYEEATAQQVPQEMQAVDVREFMARMRTKPVIRDYKKIGRNDPCPCGSGLKYKKCCLASGKYETTHQLGD